jgi:hypothetical protein
MVLEPFQMALCMFSIKYGYVLQITYLEMFSLGFSKTVHPACWYISN